MPDLIQQKLVEQFNGEILTGSYSAAFTEAIITRLRGNSFLDHYNDNFEIINRNDELRLIIHNTNKEIRTTYFCRFRLNKNKKSVFDIYILNDLKKCDPAQEMVDTILGSGTYGMVIRGIGRLALASTSTGLALKEMTKRGFYRVDKIFFDNNEAEKEYRRHKIFPYLGAQPVWQDIEKRSHISMLNCGENLSVYLRQERGNLSLEQLFNLIAQSIDALDDKISQPASNGKRHAHLDIKPDNVLFHRETGTVSMADIGMVTALNKKHEIAGTPGYIPYENLHFKITRDQLKLKRILSQRTHMIVRESHDIYSLGQLIGFILGCTPVNELYMAYINSEIDTLEEAAWKFGIWKKFPQEYQNYAFNLLGISFWFEAHAYIYVPFSENSPYFVTNLFKDREIGSELTLGELQRIKVLLNAMLHPDANNRPTLADVKFFWRSFMDERQIRQHVANNETEQAQQRYTALNLRCQEQKKELVKIEDYLSKLYSMGFKRQPVLSEESSKNAEILNNKLQRINGILNQELTINELPLEMWLEFKTSLYLHLPQMLDSVLAIVGQVHKLIKGYLEDLDIKKNKIFSLITEIESYLEATLTPELKASWQTLRMRCETMCSTLDDNILSLKAKFNTARELLKFDVASKDFFPLEKIETIMFSQQVLDIRLEFDQLLADIATVKTQPVVKKVKADNQNLFFTVVNNLGKDIKALESSPIRDVKERAEESNCVLM